MDNGTTKRSACSKGSMCCGNCHGGDYPVVAAARLVRPGDYIPRGGIMEAAIMNPLWKEGQRVQFIHDHRWGRVEKVYESGEILFKPDGKDKVFTVTTDELLTEQDAAWLSDLGAALDNWRV